MMQQDKAQPLLWSEWLRQERIRFLLLLVHRRGYLELATVLLDRWQSRGGFGHKKDEGEPSS